jgi:hypothetical protein
MSTLDRLFGRETESRDHAPRRDTSGHLSGSAGGPSSSGQLTDDQAVERYRYLLRTAPPEAIEQAHAEAFGQLTPEQRRLVLESLSRDLPSPERAGRDDPQSLARLATRTELRHPGTLERTFGGAYPGGIGVGGYLAGNFLSTIAGVVVGTAIADVIFNDGGDGQGDANNTAAADGDPGSDTADAGEVSGDAGYDTGDIGGADFGGDFGGGEF